MMQVLTKQESTLREAITESDMKVWWKKISFSDREMIYNNHRKLILQRDCSHSWRDIKYYDEVRDHCDKCDLTIPKKKKEETNKP